MQLLRWNALDAAARRAALARPTADSGERVHAEARAIVAEVRAGGDAAVRALTLRFGAAAPEDFRVSAEEFDAAERSLRPAEIAAIERAIANVRRFHEAQLGSERISVETEAGVRCERLLRPIGAVGLYVPAGSAPLPSTAIMLAVPAALAGCPNRVLCTPADASGKASAAVLVAASLCGIREVRKVGGAQAIAALAYGTDSIPKVHKIFGPGNAWVTAAKQLVAADADGAAIDLPAGPSEVLVIADDSANPGFVAADLLAQCEHDASAQALLLTDSEALANEVLRRLPLQLATLRRQEALRASVQSLRVLLMPDLATCIAACNDYAPEHLLLQTKDPAVLLADVATAGSVFLGSWSPEPMGDYCSGTNHVLPTYGHARSYSGLSVSDFQRRMTVQELSPAGLASLGPTAVTLAGLEGLDAHAAAVRLRLAALASPTGAA